MYELPFSDLITCGCGGVTCEIRLRQIPIGGDLAFISSGTSLDFSHSHNTFQIITSFEEASGLFNTLPRTNPAVQIAQKDLSRPGLKTAMLLFNGTEGFPFSLLTILQGSDIKFTDVIIYQIKPPELEQTGIAVQPGLVKFQRWRLACLQQRFSLLNQVNSDKIIRNAIPEAGAPDFAYSLNGDCWLILCITSHNFNPRPLHELPAAAVSKSAIQARRTLPPTPGSVRRQLPATPTGQPRGRLPTIPPEPPIEFESYCATTLPEPLAYNWDHEGNIPGTNFVQYGKYEWDMGPPINFLPVGAPLLDLRSLLNNNPAQCAYCNNSFSPSPQASIPLEFDHLGLSFEFKEHTLQARLQQIYDQINLGQYIFKHSIIVDYFSLREVSFMWQYYPRAVIINRETSVYAVVERNCFDAFTAKQPWATHIPGSYSLLFFGRTTRDEIPECPSIFSGEESEDEVLEDPGVAIPPGAVAIQPVPGRATSPFDPSNPFFGIATLPVPPGSATRAAHQRDNRIRLRTTASQPGRVRLDGTKQFAVAPAQIRTAPARIASPLPGSLPPSAATAPPTNHPESKDLLRLALTGTEERLDGFDIGQKEQKREMGPTRCFICDQIMFPKNPSKGIIIATYNRLKCKPENRTTSHRDLTLQVFSTVLASKEIIIGELTRETNYFENINSSFAEIRTQVRHYKYGAVIRHTPSGIIPFTYILFHSEPCIISKILRRRWGGDCTLILFERKPQ